jgi:ABC-type branched-subunit amino acid transport system ATPase component
MADIWGAKKPRGIGAAVRSKLSVYGLSECLGDCGVSGNLDFSVRDGEIVGLVGPFGSAVLDLVASNITPNFARIVYDGEDVARLGGDVRNRLGMVRVARPGELFPEMTALENAALGAVPGAAFYSRRGGMSCWDASVETLTRVGLGERRHTRAGSLSVYEQSLLTFAIALAANPSLLLLDRPSGGLTRGEQLKFGSLISSTRYDYGVTVLVAERDIFSSLWFCDRILVLRQRDGAADGLPGRTQYLENRHSMTGAGL